MTTPVWERPPDSPALRAELHGYVLSVVRMRSGSYRAKVFADGAELARRDTRDKARAMRFAESEARRLRQAGEQS
jgi:hypothetical protein